MQINDALFGKVEITEPVLVELMSSKPLQRVKGVNQGGPCQFIHRGLEENNRFGHCVGAMLLLRHFGASLQEQIAGLLHDVSHTAFSHLADYVFNGDIHKMEYQDSILEQFILKSEIPGILKRHGIAPESVLDLQRFPLQEQPIPGLCADRIDYSLRHPFFARHLAPLRPADILAHLRIRENKFVMDSPTVARAYGRAFLKWYTQELASYRCIAVHQVLADAIKRGIAIGAMSKEDMFAEDLYVMDKLRASRDPHIQERIALLNPGFDCIVDAKHPDLTSGVKFRYIDPLVVCGEALVRVSQLYPDFALELKTQKDKFDHREFPIRITSAQLSHLPHTLTAGII